MSQAQLVKIRWKQLVDARRAYDNAAHDLVMAYANHKSGEPYTEVDKVLAKAIEAESEYNRLSQEYTELSIYFQ